MMMAMTTTLLIPPRPASSSLQLQPPSNEKCKKTVVFTTPQNYASRLSHLLQLRDFNPLWCPTLIVEPTPHTIKPYLPSLLQDFSAIAFTSRTGILAFSQVLTDEKENHILTSPTGFPDTNTLFTIAALGKDAELLNKDFILKLCENPNRIRVLVPPLATPLSLVESLGLGFGRRVLCPVPIVIGLSEPPVIPNFLEALTGKGWVPVKVSAYETRWGGPNCAQAFLRRSRGEEEDGVCAIVFTSTAEVEGLLTSLRELGFDWEMVRKKWPGLVVAAHGPVTAAGAERLGVKVDVVGSRFGSFDGVVEALAQRLGASELDA